ncbi:ABC transporter substrate-binding protein [Paenibacillus qinlingensis]|uniref:Iron complex transport system substrate-binding protein n=1 Tax=Paenibacillus qinlingensis TaxID=1837343 RepID=A0ABU1NTB2_9BACL|nr:ABC transporter substrate-binding protein [Paenibacillus qinlingensis]MDR6550722.1 iron complex transport system substrate-binding protein [Paenibacillus qinlingensis]
MKTTKRSYILMMLLLSLSIFLLSACSKQEPVESGSATTSTQEKVEPRTIKHFSGETVLTGKPKAVAALNPWITDFMLALGVKPSSAVSAGPDTKDFSWYLKDQLAGTKNLGWQSETSFEAILQASPDLILANDGMGKGYEELSKIAPTIVLKPEETQDGAKDWRKTFMTVANVLQKEDEAKKVIETYDNKVKLAKEKIASTIGNETVMFLRVTDKELRYYGAKNYDILYRDLGLKAPILFPDNKATFAILQFEKLPEINPDHILVLNENNDKYEELKKNPIWSKLKAAQNNHVYPVQYDLWFQGFGPTAYSLIVDETVKLLTTKQ